jgi:hypothetical protein
MRIPLATCIKCEHKIYDNEEYDRHSFVDASGNNSNEMTHKKCPKHKLIDVLIITRYKCLDCGVVIDERNNP